MFGSSSTRRQKAKRRRLMAEPLEARRVLAASLGWDGPGLGSAELTYYIANSPDSLTQAETDAAIETALNAWASAADITFTQTDQSGQRDSIDITFTNIDGVAGTLAQAYFPDDVNPARIAGDIEFDISEAWEVGNSLGNRAFDLVYVAVHELGHSLGLDHTDSVASVLTPFVSANQAFTTLSAIDAAAVQEVYAAAVTDTPVETPTDEETTDETPTEETPTDELPTEETPTEETPTNSDDDHDHSDTDVDDTDTGDTDDDPFPRWRWRRGGNWHRWGGRLDAEVTFQNYINPTDVNADGNTSALDALMVINQLNSSSTLGEEQDLLGLCDTNGDGSITAIDALTVINAMNEGESLASITTANAEAEETELADTDTLDTDTLETDTEEPETEELDETVPDESLEDDTTLDDTEEATDETPEENSEETSDEADTTDTAEETDEPTDDSSIDDGGLVDETEVTETDTEETDTEETDTEETDTTDEEHCLDEPQSGSGVFHVGVFRNDAESLVTRLDTNDDAALAEDEVSERLWAKLLELEVDTDADGLVSIAELEAAALAARQAAFDAKDADADGLLVETEVNERFWDKIAEADTDVDGGVSFTELDTFLAEQDFGGNRSGRSRFRGRSHHDHQQSADEVFASMGRDESSSFTRAHSRSGR
ncbi:Dockerin type I repeat-containing protein [Neorhodopirellula lusitana]|uniref:Dockerin type I repeat-containing protein n=1 Tax=Neorhodopirellula lusitana TaxID=445327 RepID=A0ABY1Q8V5_9BACT|nr:matrixin family metalloprotease [Neorhodopirellula lusitana]SMP63461.1 Dockerin type I repeat-containing protein [Neorhodopirellula lusitana]